jgi:uncharacterized membrane protein YvbJ
MAKYCLYCGNEMDDNQDVCLKCGRSVRQTNNVTNHYSNDTGSAGYGILGFFFPIVGLILFLVWKDDKPRSAKSAGIGALVGVISGVVLYIVMWVIFILAFSAIDGFPYQYGEALSAAFYLL